MADDDTQRPDEPAPESHDGQAEDNRIDAGEGVKGDTGQGIVPASVKKRFIQSGEKYYFRDEKNRLAFRDRGASLHTRHTDTMVVMSMVDMAAARGWSSLHVRGAQEFRRQAWLEARIRGIEVTGFRPGEVDLARLAEIAAQRTQASPREPRSGPSMAGPAGQAKDRTVDRAADEYVGVLLAHGAAPYQNNPANKGMSYYMTYLDTQGRERTEWGQDLKRALEVVGAKMGDYIRFSKQDSKPMTINEPVVGEDGQTVAVQKKEVHRNTWDVVVGGIRSVLKSKGYSEKMIEACAAQANQELARRVAAGQPVPELRVFDIDAPARGGRERSQAGHEPRRNQERSR